MFTPVISFATEGTTTNDTVKEETSKEETTDTKNEATTGTTTGTTEDKEEAVELTESERQEKALKEAVVDKADEIYGHKFVADNGTYELYVKENNCSILIRDMKTGAILKSTVDDETLATRKYNEAAAGMITSGIAITNMTKDGDNAKESDVSGVKNASLSYNYADNGFKVHVNYSSMGIEFDVNVTLDDEGLHVEIPKSSIVESKENSYLGQVFLFNGLGLTERGDREGYMILPDGNGIIVKYADNFYINEKGEKAYKYSSGYRQRVYGSDISFDTAGSNYDTEDMLFTSNGTEAIIAPFWGMVHTDTQLAVLGVITKGDTSAVIEGNFNGVAELYENYAGSRIIYRTIFTKKITDTIQYQGTINTTSDIKLVEDAEITFMFTSGDKANYIGLAESYRNMLLKDGDIVKNTDGTFNTRIDFLGTDKENFLVFKQDVVATTVDNVREILNSLKGSGVEDILAIYTGWQEGGINETPIMEYDVSSSIGGNSEMNSLVEELKNSSVSLYLMTDMQLVNDEVDSSSYHHVKSFSQQKYEMYAPYNEVYTDFRYLIPSLTEEYMVDLSKDMKEDGLTNVAFSGMTSRLFTYYIDKKQHTRDDSVAHYTAALEAIEKDGMNVVLEKPFKYLWKYTDSYVDMPLYSSMFVYASEDIPFLSSVLKGSVDVYSEYVNFEANSTEYFLKLVESGVYPSFLITYESPNELLYTDSNWIYSSQYEQYKEKIVQYHKELKKINELVKDSYIVGHDRNDDDVAVTTYENGVKIYVNFSHDVATVDGVTLEALSYKVGEAE